MYRGQTVGVVVPAYNEEGLIGDVLATMPRYVDRIYVVDDCSTDGTWDEVRAAARADAATLDDVAPPSRKNGASGGRPGGTSEIATDGSGLLDQRAAVEESIGRVLPIAHRENRGAGGAIKTGYLAALRDDVDVTVTMDGDGQMDPDHMPKLLDPIVEDEADYAKANRLLSPAYRAEMPGFRFFGNSVLTFLTKIASGYWKTMDPQNGYTAISNDALESVGVESLYEYYGYCNDVLVKLNVADARVADVAVPANYGDEESSISYPTYIRKVSGMLLGNFLWRLKVKYLVFDFHPLALFYLFGAALATFGLAGGVWSLYATVALGRALFVRATASTLLFSVGCLFVLFAMVFDMRVNEDLEVQVRE